MTALQLETMVQERSHITHGNNPQHKYWQALVNITHELKTRQLKKLVEQYRGEQEGVTTDRVMHFTLIRSELIGRGKYTHRPGEHEAFLREWEQEQRELEQLEQARQVRKQARQAA